MSDVIDAMKRSKVPDCSAGPLSLAMQDRRVLAREIERLRAVVDKLPKTADGVSVVPGSSTVWRIGSNGEAEESVKWNGWGALFLSDMDEDGYWPCWGVAKLYSSREAADAAGGE